MPDLQLVDQQGRKVIRGRQVGRRGGEGIAYEATSHPGFIVKIYHAAPAPDKIDKLARLCQLAASDPGLLSFAAWPTSTVLAGRRPCGFLMPLVKGKEIHQLFGPRERFVEFPGANWDFLVHVARNCAAAFDSMHRLGVVIGDVNEGNLMVSPEGMVRLIDCDSYQVPHVPNGSRVWTCDVGIPLWTAPEIQGKNFRSLRRTPNHDLFGLAVLIFKTLFMGRHPYAGIPLKPVGDFVLEKAIADYLYAFSPKSSSLGVRPPPFCLPMGALPQDCAHLFSRAFLRGSERGRPTAIEWTQALDALFQGLVKCGRDPAHKFPKALAQCPWCAIAKAGGPNFFLSLTVVTNGTTANVTNLWMVIDKIEPANFPVRRVGDLLLPPMAGAALPPGVSKVSRKFVGGGILLVIGVIVVIAGVPLLGIALILFACGLLSGGRRPPAFLFEASRRQSALEDIRQKQRLLFDEYTVLAQRYHAEFAKRKSELRQRYDRYAHLERERATEMQGLEQKKRELQLQAFLDRQLINTANIPGIGAARMATLQAYGIETALDVTPQMNIPGIGDVYAARLFAWRRSCESKFTFQPSVSLPPQEVHQLNARFNSLRNNLLADLKQGPRVLENLGLVARSRISHLDLQIETNTQLVAQAAADAAALN